MSFRARITAATAGAVAIAIIIASALIFITQRHQLLRQMDQTLLQRAVRTQVRVDPSSGQCFVLPNPGFEAPVFAQCFSSKGQVLNEGASALPVTARDKRVAAGPERLYFSSRNVQGVHVRVLTVPVTSGIAVQLARPLDEVDHNLRRLTVVLGFVMLGGIAVAGGLGWVVSKAVLGPVGKLTDAAEHIAETRDPSERIEVAGTEDELGRLGTSFNAMLEALDQSLNQQRQLVADASHELRTPLTSLRTNIEVLARAAGLAPEEREKLLGDVVGQIDELTGLVANLVDLARGDEQEAHRENVRLDEIVGGSVAAAKRNFPSVTFETTFSESTVNAAPQRIERAVANLLDNAGKWSPHGGVVAVAVANGEVTVRDQGPGIEPEDLPKIFDRFYRAPAARGLPGSGLGLSIVREIARAHGGTATAEAAPDGGTIFRFKIPEAGA
jgi:two-component system sensor histidine kinase MprB